MRNYVVESGYDLGSGGNLTHLLERAVERRFADAQQARRFERFPVGSLVCSHDHSSLHRVERRELFDGRKRIEAYRDFLGHRRLFESRRSGGDELRGC